MKAQEKKREEGEKKELPLPLVGKSTKEMTKVENQDEAIKIEKERDFEARWLLSRKRKTTEEEQQEQRKKAKARTNSRLAPTTE